MSTNPAEKVSIFVDVQNIYNTCRQTYSRNFDYNKFWAKVTGGREVVSAYAYATDRGDEKQQQFQNILRAIGFTVLLKPFVQRADGSSKADWDVGITLDIYESAPHCDTVVLASGDGDFEILLRRIGDAEKQVRDGHFSPRRALQYSHRGLWCISVDSGSAKNSSG